MLSTVADPHEVLYKCGSYACIEKDQKDYGSTIFVLVFSLLSSVLHCMCNIFEMGNKRYMGQKE